MVGGLENLAFSSDFFALIYCLSVLEHVKDVDKVLAELYRVLKYKGNLIMRVGNGGRCNCSVIHAFFNYIFRRNEIKHLTPSCQIRNGHEQEDHRFNFDFHEIPSDVLLRLLKEKGFTIVYFSTTELYRKLKPRNLRQRLNKFLIFLSFFPFTHLGSTIFLIAEKK